MCNVTSVSMFIVDHRIAAWGIGKNNGGCGWKGWVFGFKTILLKCGLVVATEKFSCTSDSAPIYPSDILMDLGKLVVSNYRFSRMQKIFSARFRNQPKINGEIAMGQKGLRDI